MLLWVIPQGIAGVFVCGKVKQQQTEMFTCRILISICGLPGCPEAPAGRGGCDCHAAGGQQNGSLHRFPATGQHFRSDRDPAQFSAPQEGR